VNLLRRQKAGKTNKIETSGAWLVTDIRLTRSQSQSAKLIGLLLLVAILPAACKTPDTDPFDDDFEEKALQVNEGQLTFIAPITDRPVLHAETELWLTRASLHSGWVAMRQCYRQLDATARTDVVSTASAMSMACCV